MSYVDTAKTYVGVKGGSATHHSIIDYYNSNIKPLPRGYAVKYSDAWCAIFVSVIMKKCGAINAPYECSVYYMYRKAKANNQIITNPKPNDFIIYDWKNDGTYDHVGVIESVSSTALTVIEGNWNNAVCRRTVNRNSNEIECFFRVPTTSSTTTTTNTDIEQVVTDVIRGKYGNGAIRKKRLEQLGYNYTDVQNRVNARLSSKSNSDIEQVVTDVIRGKYGNGAIRKKRLEQLGYNYNEIQKKVNERLKAN